ncbi:outer membrane protein H precursor [Ichthyobacterium seriolicida]|uniref:Outer membrane protein H n=2 Tax=Ichthyobacterium seriolicida TaxID=242600 RepID=A0A1J1DY73_9FLAO|nr:outer membrane protein H precursor [Ichthyobacterium seriolicida]
MTLTNCVKSISVLVFSLFFVQASHAQIGHVNSAEILTVMPETKKIETELESIRKTYEDELMVMVKELEEKNKKYQKEATGKGDAINEQRMKSLQEMQIRIEKFRETAATELQQKQIKLMEPIRDRIRVAIEAVRKAKKLDYILDVISGGIVAFDPSKDVTSDVKSKLKTS